MNHSDNTAMDTVMVTETNVTKTNADFICVMQILCTDGSLQIHAQLCNTLLTKITNNIDSIKTTLFAKNDVLTTLSLLANNPNFSDRQEDVSTILPKNVRTPEYDFSRQSSTTADVVLASSLTCLENGPFDALNNKVNPGINIAGYSESSNSNVLEHSSCGSLDLKPSKSNKKLKQAPIQVIESIKVSLIDDTKLKIQSRKGNTFWRKTESGILDGKLTDYPFQCTICKLRFRKRFSLLCHSRTHDTTDVMLTTLRPYQCSECQRSFRRIHILCQHLYTHKPDEEKPFKCSGHCGQRFSTKNQLINHIKAYKNIKPHHCTICNKTCSTNAALKDHMVSHSASRPHLCLHCGKSFARKSQLTRHYYQHTAKTYQCDHCGKLFPTITQVKEHTSIHDVNRIRYPCSYCNVTLSKQSHLNRHVRTVHKNLPKTVVSPDDAQNSNAN